jgi:hypothetical protein
MEGGGGIFFLDKGKKHSLKRNILLPVLPISTTAFCIASGLGPRLSNCEFSVHLCPDAVLHNRPCADFLLVLLLLRFCWLTVTVWLLLIWLGSYDAAMDRESHVFH